MEVAGAVHQAALPQRLGEHHLDRADQPGGAVGDHQQRRPQAAGDQLAEEAGPRVVALVGAGCQPQQHRAALSGDAPGGKHRLGRRPWMHPKMRAVQEQVLQLDPAKVAGRPGVELVLCRLADAADGRLRRAACGPSTSPKAASTSRAVAAPERADLGLQGGLHDQPHAQPGNLLQDLPEVLLGGEGLVDLGVGMRSVAESLGARAWPPQLELVAQLGAYARPAFAGGS